MSNYPKVYGFCDAGCRRRVPTYDEFAKSASIIPIADEKGMFKMEIGKTYLVDIGATSCNIPIYWETERAGNHFEIVCDSPYRKSAKVALFDIYDELVSGVYKRKVVVEIDGVVKTIQDPVDDTTSRTSAYTYLKEKCYMFLYTEESGGGTPLNRVNAVYLVNEDATITAEAGKSAYEVALENGFEGTEAEWLASLKGDKGDKGEDGEVTYDYTNSTFANALKKTVSGEVVRVDDVSPIPHKVKVKVTCPEGIDPTSVTVTRSGKNLIRDYRYSSFNYQGITAVNNEDGSITLNGTATGNTYYEIIMHNRNSFSLGSGQYVFSLGASLPTGCGSDLSEFANGSSLGQILNIKTSMSYGVIYTDHRIEKFTWYIFIPTGTVLNNYTIYPQIERGNVPTEFEKPNYQTLTPNADGTVDGMTSVSPVTTIYSDTDGLTFEAEYNVDAQKEIAVEIEGMKSDVDDVCANALKKRVTDAFVHCDGLSPLKHKVKVKVSGVDDPTAVKVTRTGKNLIPFPYSGSYKSQNGITMTVDEDGVITINGTATGVSTALGLLDSNTANIVLNGNYTVSLGDHGTPAYLIVAFDDGTGISSRGLPGVELKGDTVNRITLFVDEGTYNNVKLYPMIEVGATATEYEKGTYTRYTPNADGTIEMDSVDDMNIYTDTDGALLDVEYNADLNEELGGFPYKEYSLPVVYFEGDVAKMTKDDKVTLAYRYGDRSGTCTLKWQGSSSIAYPKKNYTVVFDNAFEAADGWGEESKYCLKADWIDFSHCRNVNSAKLWGGVVRSRATSDLVTKLTSLVNCGAIDGFPCFVVINGEWQGIYNFNIPKEGYMLGMGSGAKEAILCCGNHTDAARFRAEAVLDTDFDLEYSADSFASSDIQASLNRLINACINSNGSDIDTTIAQYLDINSAIDYYIFTVLLGGNDLVSKNYILGTYDGTKWFFSAYDLDSTWGLMSDGKKFIGAGYSKTFDSNKEAWLEMSFNRISTLHRLFYLLYTYKKPEIIARYKQLRSTVFSVSRVVSSFYNYGGQIPLAAFNAEAELWKAIPNTSVNNVAQIASWYQDRVLWVDEEIAQMEN